MRFLLIHGGFHGAWCWRELIPQIERLGHATVAIDLPGHGERSGERGTLADRRDAIVAAMQPGDVLVGHSAGGFDMTLAADAANVKIGHMIYLAAAVPIEGRSLLDALGGETGAKEPTAGELDRLREMVPNQALRPTPDGRLQWADRELAKQSFYHDCDPILADWAFDHLTPASQQILSERVSLPRFWAANLPRSYIVCLKDRVLPYAKALAFAGRLGVAPLYIDASHSPFLSRPAELGALLIKAVASRPVAGLQPS